MSVFNSLSRPLLHTRRTWLLTIRMAEAVRRQRRRLAMLDDTRLADLGLSRAQAETEANRPVWDIPVNWRQ